MVLMETFHPFTAHNHGTWPQVFPREEAEFSDLHLLSLVPNFPLNVVTKVAPSFLHKGSTDSASFCR